MKPVRNPGYLRWIRSLPVQYAARRMAVEAAIPARTVWDRSHRICPPFLCVESITVRRTIRITAGASKVRRGASVGYPGNRRSSQRETIHRVESGAFVGRFGDQEYELDPRRPACSGDSQDEQLRREKRLKWPEAAICRGQQHRGN